MRQIIKLTIFIVTLCIALACSNNKEQTTTFNSKAKGSKTLKGEKLSNFTAFFKRFYSDSTYQIQNIEFPLQFIYYDDNIEKQELIIKKEWGFITIDKEIATETKIISHSKVRVIYYIPDTCFYQIHDFELRNGRWILVKITDQSN